MPKILITEDNPKFQKIFKDSFIKEGFEVILASNGQEGLEAAKVNQPDIILLDLIMPNVNGKEFLIDLRREKGLASIPVVVLSNVSDPEISVNPERKSQDIGEKMKNKLEVDDYLIKTNYTLDQIVKSVKEVLAS